MDSIKIEQLEQRLQSRLNRFIQNSDSWGDDARTVLEFIREQYGEDSAYLCGGAVRRLVLVRVNEIRDIDIIVRDHDAERIRDLFKAYQPKMNRFGGVSFQVIQNKIDIWPLSETWAFKQRLVGYREHFEDYTKTTFLDIDAIAVQLFVRSGRMRTIYSKGFFEAILNESIDINLEANPDPLRCLVKSLALAEQLNFSLQPRLARYIVTTARRYKPEEMSAIYRYHYGNERLTAEVFQQFLESISEQLHSSPGQAVRLPAAVY